MRARGGGEASHLLGLIAAHPPFCQKDTEADDPSEFSVQTRESGVHNSARAIDQDRGSGWSPAHASKRSSPPGRRSSHPASEHDVLSVLSSSASVSVAPRRLQQGTRPGLPGLGRGKFGRQFITDQNNCPQTWNSDLRHNANTSDIAGDAAACLEADGSRRIAVASCPSRRHRLRQNQGRQTASPPAGRGQRRGRAGANRQFPPPDGVDPVAAGVAFPGGGVGPRQEHGQADCPAARPRSQGSTKWTLSAHHHAVSPIASPVAHAGTAALQQPWREQEEKILPASTPTCPSEPAENQPLSDLGRGARTSKAHTAHSPFLAVTFGLVGSGRGAGSWWSGRWAKPVRDI